MNGLHFTGGDWQLMAQGFVNAIYDRQTGPRGDEKVFTESMAMLMANRPLGPGTIGLRGMVSLDPTMGKSGYPLLVQTGETADGTTPLVDRQHPHDFFMELATSYSVQLGESSAAFAYVGLPGEPALGPSAFMHRFSAMRNPEAPLTHHWLDSTHITFGVATLGVSRGPLQLEGSWFNGREPDPLSLEHRDAQVRFMVDPPLVQPGCRALAAGELRRPGESRAARAGDACQADDRLDHATSAGSAPTTGERRSPTARTASRAPRRT